MTSPFDDPFALPRAPVRVRASRADVPRGAMLRAYRAAGLAAGRTVTWVDVELDCGTRYRGARWVSRGAGTVLRVHLDDVASKSAAALGRALREHLGDADRSPLPTPEPPAASGRVLLFENLFRDPDRPGDDRGDMACGTFQLASALRGAGHRVSLVRGALAEDTGLDDPRPLLEVIASQRPRLAGITVLEACLPGARALTDILSQEKDLLVAVGGAMVTWSPLHALAHLPGAHLAVRGDGEEILPLLAATLADGVGEGAEEILLGLDGVILLRGDRLVAGRLDRPARADVDRTPMDFDQLEARHLSRGLSLETGRGCAHACLFCTTPGRRDHRGRSAAAVADGLRRYEARLESLFGRDVPRIARRLQICDDDFTSDPGRAIEVLRAVGASGLRLAAFQASIGDLWDREAGAVREALLDAIRPELFQDSAQLASARAPSGRLPAHTGAFLHLGVESFADGDLRRLGKGYTAEMARQVVDGLDRRGIVHDAYLILGNRGTTLEDLADSLWTVCQLKIEHPDTFFVRTPAVPFVVPTFPSASYAAWSRRASRGEARGQLEVDRTLTVAGFPEFDYPLVVREVPSDPDVAAACERWESILELDARYERPLSNLRDLWMERLRAAGDPDRAGRLRRAIRRLSSARQRIVLRGVARARNNELSEAVAARYWAEASELGLPDEVIPKVRNALEVGDPRLVVIPTRDCSLRCAYCPADKASGAEMTRDTMLQSLELLLSTQSPRGILQFFGGEALLRRDDVLWAMDRGAEMAAAVGKQVGFIVSTNGLSLDEELLSDLASRPVKIEISLDGAAAVHNRHRRPLEPGVDSYAAVTRHLPALIDSGIDHEVILVVTPETVGDLCDSFFHVASLGLRRIQVNHGLAVTWSLAAKRTFAAQLKAIEDRFFASDLDEAGLEWIDLRSFRDPMLLNGEVTVDHDGTVYHGNGFLIRTADPARFRAGHLDDLEALDTYVYDRPDNAYLVRHTYPREVARNSIEVGRIYWSFVRHMRQRFPELETPRPTRCPRPGGTQP